MTEAWHVMTALGLGNGIGRGAIDPVELAEHFLERIAEHDLEHKIYLRTTPERARAEALAARERARSDSRRGPLDGVPLSWKDLFDSAGIITCMGSPLLAERVPERDAEVLARGDRAGTVCLGKTNLVEFALGALGINPSLGTPENPFDNVTPRCPGGSTAGGAVSVARGLAPAAIGSDSGGSVRVPASWNGLVGLKTTVGLVPVDGVLPLAPSLDSVGPLTRDVADANAILGMLLERKPAELETATLAECHFLVATTIVEEHVRAGVARAFESALERVGRAGAKLVRDAVPEFAAVEAIMRMPSNVMACEAAQTWGLLVATAPERVFRPIAERMLAVEEHSPTELEANRHRIAALRSSYLARTADFAAVIAPTVLIPPPPIAPIEDGGEAYSKANFDAILTARLGNQLGLCALTLPCGTDDEGLPVGLMLMAPPFAEDDLLRTGYAVEAALAD